MAARCLEQAGQRTEHRAVVDPVAPPLSVDQTRFEQHAHVVTDRRLRQKERIRQVADARLMAWLSLDPAGASSEGDLCISYAPFCVTRLDGKHRRARAAGKGAAGGRF